MKFLKTFFFVSVFVNTTFILSAQDEEKPCQEITNKKAIKAYKEGINRNNKKEERLAFLKKAMELEPDYVDANFAYAEERIKTLAIDEAPFKPTEEYFKKVIEICPKYHSDPYYYLGFIYYEESKWEECVKYLKEFQKFKDDDIKKFNKNYDGFLAQSKKMLVYAKFYLEINKNPVPFDPNPVNGICTTQDEYLGIISPDNQMCFFTRKQARVNKFEAVKSEKEDEFFCFSKRDPITGEFDRGAPMPFPFNSSSNEGGATISIDNKHLFFTVCKNEGGPQMNCDIYFSDLVNGEWTKPAKVPEINDPGYWDSQPTLAADGKTLYFCSDRKGGYGGVDIYRTVKNTSTGIWSKPVNAGRPINTEFDEFSPFLHSDFQSLYFSSDGHPSVGGQDIYFSHAGDDGKWSEPKNLGIPINTVGDDLGFFVSTDGHLGYFASNQPGRVKGKSVGKYDIYSFDLYKEVRPDEVVFLTGKVEDNAKTGSKNVSVNIKDAVSKKATDAVVDTATGEYMAIVNVKNKHDLIVTVNKDNAAFSSQLISKEAIAQVSTSNNIAAEKNKNTATSGSTPIAQSGNSQINTSSQLGAATNSNTTSANTDVSTTGSSQTNTAVKTGSTITNNSSPVAGSNQTGNSQISSTSSNGNKPNANFNNSNAITNEGNTETDLEVGEGTRQAVNNNSGSTKDKVTGKAAKNANNEIKTTGATNNTILKPLKANLILDTIKVGQKYKLNDIYYNTNSAELQPRSLVVVEQFVDYLKANPSIKIEIHGHTDNVGNEKDNLALSTDRAFTVLDLIVKMGVEESRILAFKGFGSTQPVADNATEEGRSKNRRTEFMIIEK